ncbi:MAG: peptide-methionine (S)-S-oxide reductase MsrA, partial [Deltaproteobacteria bacterium]
MEKKMHDEPPNTKEAYFAGGCFWCTEADFEKVNGVIDAISGYTGGHVANPTYEQVSAGGTGHVEAVKVIYDPAKVSYEQLLQYFWRHIDPTEAGGQFVDRGPQYRSVIFYSNEQEHRLAE